MNAKENCNRYSDTPFTSLAIVLGLELFSVSLTLQDCVRETRSECDQLKVPLLSYTLSVIDVILVDRALNMY